MVDAKFEAITEPAKMEMQINNIPGSWRTDCSGLADEVLVGEIDGDRGFGAPTVGRRRCHRLAACRGSDRARGAPVGAGRIGALRFLLLAASCPETGDKGHQALVGELHGHAPMMMAPAQCRSAELRDAESPARPGSPRADRAGRAVFKRRAGRDPATGRSAGAQQGNEPGTRFDGSAGSLGPHAAGSGPMA